MTARRHGRLVLLVALHSWGPLFLLATAREPNVAMVTASLIFSVLTTGSVTLPYALSRRHGWLRALLVSSLVGAVLLLPLGLLATDFSVSSSTDRSEVASWVFVGLVLPPVFSFTIFVPLSAWRWLPRALRSMRRRSQAAASARTTGKKAPLRQSEAVSEKVRPAKTSRTGLGSNGRGSRPAQRRRR